MVKIPERLPDNERHNRSSRRAGKRLNPDYHIESAIVEAFTKLDTAERIQRRNRGTLPVYNLGASLFQGEAAGILQAQGLHDISVAMDEANRAPLCEPHQEWLEKIKYTDYYRLPVNGLSLADIERMPLPLKELDALRIARIFHEPILSTGNSAQRIVEETIVYTAVEPLTRPGVRANRSLHPLRERLTSLFDYFTNYLTAPHSNQDQDKDFIQTLGWGGTRFKQAVGLYVAASTGLSPASVLKLFKKPLDDAGRLWGSGSELKKINKEVGSAYYPEGEYALPDELQPYLFYDPDSDKKATSVLKSAYSSRKDVETAPFGFEESRSLIRKLIDYKADILQGLQDPLNQYARFDVDTIPGAKEIALALRRSSNPLNRNIFMVLFFEDPSTHLTLELNRHTTRLYGVPPELTKRIPHIDELLVRDLLGGVIVNQVEQKNPWLIAKPKSTCLSALPVRQTDIQTPEDSEELVLESEVTSKPRKRKRLGVALGVNIVRPELPKVADYIRSYTVDYDEDMVRRKMGDKASDNDVKQIMAVLVRFENGGVRGQKVRTEAGTIRIRSGDYRVKLKYTGGTNFDLDEIPKRRDAYK